VECGKQRVLGELGNCWSSFVFTSLATARRKARDAIRIVEKTELIKALKMARIDLGDWPESASGGTGWSCLGSVTCWDGNYSGLASLDTTLQKYISPIPTPHASGNNHATNAYMYISNHSTAPCGASTGRGAYLLWYQEQEITASKCNSSCFPHYDKYWYCHEFLGR
jgi:hypothetical protein